MKTLCLLRHAKSSWAESGKPDIDRPLNERGRMAAGLVGRHLRAQRLEPDLVLCSPAARTRETLAVLLAAAGWSPPVEYPARLYPGEPHRVLAEIAAADDAVERLLVIGHNPGLHRLAWDLTSPRDSDLRRRLGAKFPTASLAVIGFDTAHWQTVGPGRGSLLDFTTPKRLAEA